MAKPASCHTCIYAHRDLGLWLRTLWSGFPARPLCGNQPDSPGRMKECPHGRVCRNYRPRPPVPTGANVRMIPLTGGFYAYVDAEDYEQVKQWRWRAHSGGYAVRWEKDKLILMHRQIMQTPEGMVVDHVNGNGYDNTRANMRNVTRRENMHNMSKHAGAASIYKGVVRGKRKGTWYARVGWGDTHSTAGPFEEEAEAARAYDRMAVERFGEVVRLNFPEEWPAERRAQVYAEAREKREALSAKAAAKREGKSRRGRKRRGKTKVRKQEGKKEKNGRGRRGAAGKKLRIGKRRMRATRTRSGVPAAG
jgi:hypothetical protein